MFSLKLNHSGWCSQWHHVLSGSLSQIQLLSLKIYRTIHVCLYCISTWCFLTTSVVEAETMRDNENTRGASFLLCSDIYDECADYFAGMAHTEDDLCLRRENYQPQCPHREGPHVHEKILAQSPRTHTDGCCSFVMPLSALWEFCCLNAVKQKPLATTQTYQWHILPHCV